MDKGDTASMTFHDLCCLQRLVMEEGGTSSLTWLPRASMTLQRPAMADGGAVSMNWLFRDCLVLHRPAVEEGGVASPAWLPREWLALEKSTMEEGHSFPSLTLQSITTPGESSYGRGSTVIPTWLLFCQDLWRPTMEEGVRSFHRLALQYLSGPV